MQRFQRQSWSWLVVLLAWMAAATPVNAYHRHGANRQGRGYNSGMASMQRASAAITASQARVFAARTKLARETRQAKQQAESSPAVVSAKKEYTQAERDYQSARTQAIENMKQTNPDFKSLVQECQSLRQRIASAAKTGNASENLRALQSQLKSKTRRAMQMEEDAINSDTAVKTARERLAETNASQVTAKQDIQNAIEQNPQVQTARKQVAQASQQALRAATRNTNTSRSGYSRGFSQRRGYGSGRGYHVHQAKFAHHRHR